MSAEHAAELPAPLPALAAAVNDASLPIAQRMRAVFWLRTAGGDAAVDALCTSVRNKALSVLYRHETAYCLGQMQNPRACAMLTEVLSDVTDDDIVRHECGEALGALAQPESLEVLERFSSDRVAAVAETCTIAASRLRWAIAKKSEQGASEESPYLSVDPAPAAARAPVAVLQATLCDAAAPLYDRYRAMFALRNINSPEAAMALCAAFDDKTSALFRHEVAYVLGQMQQPCTSAALIDVMLRLDEHPMVRHESAEALGAIGGEECAAVLERFKADPASVVAESCIVALDAVDYWAALGSDK